MKTSSCEVAVIGAGPYGLAAAAHLKSAGLETKTFGQTMEFWRKQMPERMLLRSPWDASHIADPHHAFSLDAYEKMRGVHLERPLPLQDFIDYGQWFQRNAVPDLDTRHVHRVEQNRVGFTLTVGNGGGEVEAVEAKRVVIAAGIARFARRPLIFTGPPPSLVSHASDHRDLSVFCGQRVSVVGGGQSAIETAALLAEEGARVELIVRRKAVRWLRRSALLHNTWNPLRRLLYHRTDVGPAVVSQIVSRPYWYRRLPLAVQQRLTARAIRPAGAAWLMSRMQGVQIVTGRHAVAVQTRGSEIGLILDDGYAHWSDHVILGTGYRVDVARYDFFSPKILEDLDQDDGYPVLNRGLESSIAGLHFVGAPAARSFGPLMRFVSGTEFVGRTLTEAIASRNVSSLSQERPQWLHATKPERS